MLLFVAGVILTAARRWLPSLPLGAAAVVILAIAAWSLYAASSLGVFRAWEGERKYSLRSACSSATACRSSAFVLAAQHSGSLRYYSHRPTLRWDLLDPAWLDRALRSMRAAGYDPFLVVDAGEDEAFRQNGSAGPASVRWRI